MSHDDGGSESISPFVSYGFDACRRNPVAVPGKTVTAPRAPNDFQVSQIIHPGISAHFGPCGDGAVEAQDLRVRIEDLGKPMCARSAPTDNRE